MRRASAVTKEAATYIYCCTALSCMIHSLWCKFLLHACIRFSLIETMWLEKPSQRPSFAEIVTILKQGEKRMALVARNCILYLKIPFVFSVLDVMKWKYNLTRRHWSVFVHKRVCYIVWFSYTIHTSINYVLFILISHSIMKSLYACTIFYSSLLMIENLKILFLKYASR